MTDETSTNGPASYFPAIEKKYGQPISHWLELLKTVNAQKHMERVAWLKNRAPHGPWPRQCAGGVLRGDGKKRLSRRPTLQGCA